METTQNKHALRRRSFFKHLFSGIAGGLIGGNLFLGIARSTGLTKSKNAIQVRINPLAIPRTKKDVTSDGA